MFDIDDTHKDHELLPLQWVKKRYPSLSKLDWCNKQSKDYYQNISVEKLQLFTKLAGIENCCEIDLIYHQIIDKTTVVLDVMSGYGRVVQGLLNRGYSGKIIAVEREPSFYHYLTTQFRNNTSVRLLCDDIMTAKINCRVDVILLLWSAISEFSKHQQLNLLSELNQYLQPGGNIIIDTLPININPRNFYKKKQHFIVCTSQGTLHGYLPSYDEIQNYANTLGLILDRYDTYKTNTQLTRLLYVLRKP